MLVVAQEEQRMPHFHVHDEKMKCPYKGCGMSFQKPSVLTDTTAMPRETYYACPYCMSKLDVIVEDLKIIGVKPAEYPKVFDSPAKCARYTGFLNSISKEGPIPDECLVCPKVLQCSVRK
jgi:hypothetical protein